MHKRITEDAYKRAVHSLRRRISTHLAYVNQLVTAHFGSYANYDGTLADTATTKLQEYFCETMDDKNLNMIIKANDLPIEDQDHPLCVIFSVPSTLSEDQRNAIEFMYAG